MDKRVRGKENGGSRWGNRRGNWWKREATIFLTRCELVKVPNPRGLRETKVAYICCEWSRSMGTTRRVRRRLRRRRDRVLLGALRFLAFTSSWNRLSPCDDGGRQPLSWLAYPQTTCDFTQLPCQYICPDSATMSLLIYLFRMGCKMCCRLKIS